MSMLLSLIAAVLLLVPTAAVLVGVAVSGRRDRAWARSVAEVLAEFRAQAAVHAPGPPDHGPGGGPDGPGTPAAPASEPPPARLAQVIAFPGSARAGSGSGGGSAGGSGGRRAA